MARVQAIYMQNFSSLALKLREEFEVTDNMSKKGCSPVDFSNSSLAFLSWDK